MEMESCVPPGFRFHPTEEELVGYYLTRKVASQKIDLEVIRDIDLYRIEPWDLKDRCRHGYEEQSEWYFFSHKDKKYPSGTRTNRATAAGFWKATGRDKSVLSKNKLIGMRKTLVFYKGRAPNGRKSDWIIHEYRLQSTENGPPQEEGWVVCRAFRKQTSLHQRPCFNMFNPAYCITNQEQYGGEGLQDISPSTNFVDSYNSGINFHGQPLGVLVSHEIEPRQSYDLNHLLEMPQLDSPSLSTSVTNKECLEPSFMANEECGGQRNDCVGQFIDWQVLDNLLAGQASESASCSNSNVPMIPLNSGADAQNQEDHFLASFHSQY